MCSTKNKNVPHVIKDSKNIQYDATRGYNKMAAPIFRCYGEE